MNKEITEIDVVQIIPYDPELGEENVEERKKNKTDFYEGEELDGKGDDIG